MYQKEIIRIADGNPRIEIMASRLAKEEQNISGLYDVSDLFEKYFLTFVNDNNQFANAFNIKVLGLVAFFNTMPYKNKNITEPVLADFRINYMDFIESVDKLDQLELLEIQYDRIKIPEQNLSTYFCKSSA